MTEPRTNRLIANPGGRTVPFVEVAGEQVPTEIYAYCAWLNGHELRRGLWRVIELNGKRSVEFAPEIATDDWLREKGMAPRIGRAA